MALTKKAKAGGALVFASAGLMAFLGVWEGNGQHKVYADKLAGGLPTVCRGITKHVTKKPVVVGEIWSAEKCDAEERDAVTTVQSSLIKCFTVTPPQRVFDAATSHAWNNGVSATCNSLAMQAWRSGDWSTGCRRIYQSDTGKAVWSYVRTGRMIDGKPEMKFVQGLANRRLAEYNYCMGLNQ
jgi:lysozyme